MSSPDTVQTSWAPRVFGASVIGPLHLQLNLPCQDACAYRVLTSGWFAIAVADGLGSASMSEMGARIAVESGLNAVMNALDVCGERTSCLEEIVRSAAGIARNALERHSVAESCKLRDLACTLIVTVAREDGLAVAHIGDGAVVGQVDGRLSLLSLPGESEFTNEVVPLTSANWEEQLKIVSYWLPIRFPRTQMMTKRW